jgi:chromosome segregation ATPase
MKLRFLTQVSLFIAILYLEIERLEKEKSVIKKENKEREAKSIKIIKSDHGHDDRMSSLKETMTDVKTQISKLEEAKAQQNMEYDNAMNELRRIDNEFRSLREK